MEVDVFQIFDYIKKESDNNSEFCINVGNLLADTHNSKFEVQLDALWCDYCNRNNLCEECGTELKVKTEYEKEEYQGFILEKPIYELYCDNCG